MTVKIWEVKEGKITSLIHTNIKGENILLVLKGPIDYDNSARFSELGRAIDLVIDNVSLVKEMKGDATGATDTKDNKKDIKSSALQKEEEIKEIEKNPNINDPNLISTTEFLKNEDLNEKLKENLGSRPRDKENEMTRSDEHGECNNKKEGGTEVRDEVSDKLDALLQIDNKSQREAVEYLIQKYAKNRDITKPAEDAHNDVQNDESNDCGLLLVSKEDIAIEARPRGDSKEKEEPYKMYDVAIHKFIPDILEKIKDSKDGMIRVRIADMAKQLGEEFVNKNPVTLYTGLRYTLFDHNIIVEMGSLKDVDPITNENIRALKMRMKNPKDKLPPSLMQRRGEFKSGQEDKKEREI